MKHALEPDAPIGSVAREHPDYIGVLDRFAVDYCCHGHETVLEACARAGVDVDLLSAAIAAVETRAHGGSSDSTRNLDPARFSMSELCDHIEVRYHGPARDMLARLSMLADRVESVHGAEEPAVRRLAEIVRALGAEMIDHMTAEERVLFRWIRRLEKYGAGAIGPPWSVSRPIGCMMHDHTEVAARFLELRELEPRLVHLRRGCASMASLLDALHAFERDTRHHIHAENNILFPAAERAEALRERCERTVP